MRPFRWKTVLLFAFLAFFVYSGSAYAQGLPSGWSHGDVGSVGVAGSASYANGSFTVKGAGSQIYGSADSFHFLYQPLSGDGTIAARIVSVQGGSGYAAAGVMIRETLDAGSTNAKTADWSSYGAIYFDERATTGGSTSEPGGVSITLPYWVKVVRSGSTFSSYTSTNGLSWTQLGSSQTITMAQNVYIGLAVTSANTSAVATAVFDNVSTNSALAPTPVIAGVSAAAGVVGSQTVISGSGFGATQGSSLVLLNQSVVGISAWSNTSITITIPTGATSGSLMAFVGPTLNASNSVPFIVPSQPLPSWLDVDVGQVGLAGSASYANGAFTVAAAGQYISGTADGMHFVYQQMSGDGSIVARVSNLQGANAMNSEAGVMIRETLDPGSANAFIYYFPNQGYMYDRPSTGASTASQSTGIPGLVAIYHPYWTKLTRSGNSITGYASADGVNWTQIGTSQTVTMAQGVYFGLAVSANSTSTLTTATFDNVSINSAAAPAPVIAGVSATTGSIGSQVVISGSYFGATQSSSVVTLNGIGVTINSWSDTSIKVTIPTGATSGPLLVSVAPTMNDSNYVSFEVTSQPLPVGWLDSDVGPVGIRGSATYASGTFTIAASGQGISFPSDEMHFVYLPLSGDGTIVARVASAQGTQYLTAGAMFRETLAPGSMNVYVAYQPSTIYLSDRPSTGGSTSWQSSVNATLPYWIRLIRSGNTFSAYAASDGQSWTQVGASQTISMAQNAYVGLAVSNESDSSLANTTFDNVSVVGGTPHPVPVITSMSPNSGALGSSVTIAGVSFGTTQGSSTINFNGVAASSVASWSNGQIVATVPNSATTGPVTVLANSIRSNSNFSFTVIHPVVSSVTPPSASVGGSVVVTGSGFAWDQGGHVLFNGVTASGSNLSATSATVTVPSGATSGPVTVSIAGVASNGLQFTVLEPLSITAVSPAASSVGSTVTISGAGFGANQSTSTASFYGAPATVVSWSDTAIVTTVPAGATTGPVTVQVAGTTIQGPLFKLNATMQLTDSLGNHSSYTSVVIGGKWTASDVQGSGCSSCTTRGVVHYTYDSSGNVLAATDALGHTTTYTYDSSNNLLSQTVQVDSTTNATTTYTYNSFGEVLTVTDALGHVTTNTYDGSGNLLSVTSPAPDGNTAASVTQFAYDAKGELTQITDPLNRATTLTYTAAGLIATIKDAQNNVTTYGYDAHGNRTSVTDALNHQTTFAYDTGDRLTTITYPDNTTTTLAYDTRGRRTSLKDQNGKTTTYVYDDADRLTSVKDAANNTTTYGYDTEGNLTSIQDANGHSTALTYDAFGRVTHTNFPSTLTETYGYDANNNLTNKTDRKGQTINYVYDDLNRLTKRQYPDSTEVDYVYDLVGKIQHVNDPTGTYALAYDNTGRLIGTTTSYSFLTGRNFTTSYSYDKASNRTGSTDPEGGATAYVYDTLNRLTTLTPPSAFTTGSFGFSYDALSRRTQMTRPNNVASNYSYDNLSRLSSVLHQLSGSTIDGARYALDNSGNRTAKTDQHAGVTSNYAYDAVYELTGVTQGTNTTESYTYDAVGNRTASLGAASYTNNVSNEVAAKTGVTYTYDNNGNTLTKIASTGTTSYTWDFENRLSSVTLPGSGGTVAFKYDPFGRRIEKITSSTTSIYAYDADNLIEETNSSGAVVARYEQTQNVNEPLAMLRSGGTSYYEQDDLGSVTSLSNAAGSLAQTYTFDSFGNQTASTGSLTNPFRFAGREFDTESSLYYMRARYFDPVIGRFISEDPTDEGSLYDDLNLYVYTENNPTNWTDPLGLYTLKKGGKNPPLPPSPVIDALLKCIEGQTGLSLTVTSTSEDIPQHPPGTPHRRGVAVDLKYDSGNAGKILCAASGCGAGFGLDEAKHPSPQSTGNHIHLQIPPGKHGGHGDLPTNTCSGSGCK